MSKVSIKSYFFINISLFIFLIIFIWISLFSFSTFKIEPLLAFKTVFSNTQESIAQHLVFDIRLPRALASVLCGALLATAGSIMQGITNNPLASPSILGINSGAALGMAFVSTLAPWFGIIGTSSAALIGGAISWALVMTIGKNWQYGNENIRLVLAGVAISAFCSALTKAFIILEEEQASGVLVWLAGTFANIRWINFNHLLLIFIISTVGTILISPKLNLLKLGNEYAISLGVSPKKYQLLGSILVLIIVCAVLTNVGSLGFVGLLIPHMARFIIGTDHRMFIPTAMLLGANLVVFADLISRAIIFPMETPAGAILALIGAPFFIYLVRKKS